MSQLSISIGNQKDRRPQIAFPQAWRRALGWGFGIGTQVLFFYTVIYLFLSLRFGNVVEYAGWWLIDIGLAIGFAIPHSLLLAPPVQSRLKLYLPSGLLGCLHCSVTCLTLLVMVHYWGHSSVVVWKATGWSESLIVGLFYASWVALLYSLWLTGMGYQTGLTQWWYWARRIKPPARPFVTRGAFRWMRHPVYMSFLGLIWFTPEMALDHMILTAIWTGYIYLGSYFKDRRLLRYIGPAYQAYGQRVAGLPLIGIGSLRRFRAGQSN